MKRYSQRKFSTLAFLFILISIPLAVYSLVNIRNFDKRNKAADFTQDIETCQISFIYVNPQSIAVNTKVQANVSAYTPGEAVSQVMVMDRTGSAIFKKDFTDGRDKVSENFVVNPKTTGDFAILGTLTTDKGTRPCVVKDNTEVRIVSANTAPEFKSLPTSANPSNSIKVKDSYQYQFEATDLEKDTINFAFSFTPDATWLKSTVIENGTNGKLAIKFFGTPDKPGSYLANIFVHDGYNAHLRAQTWIINVNQDQNDTPKVSIIKPNSDISIKKGEDVTISWEGADLNRITKYELYIASNPGNSNSWVAISKNLSPKIGNYIFDTKSLIPGTYQFIVKAYDNFNPPAVGTGVSAKVNVQTVEKPIGPDDGVVLQEAQITNISPSNESSIKNKNASISATLIPSKDAKVKKESIKLVFDDLDITDKTRINEVLDNQYSVLYTPEQQYSEGVHKVTLSFEDTKGIKAEKSWTFTIINEDTTDSDVFKIFGFEIPKRLATIIAAGLAILLLALIVPWLLYLAWRGSQNEEDEYVDVYENTTPPLPNDSEVLQVDIADEQGNDLSINKPKEVETTKKVLFPKFNLEKKIHIEEAPVVVTEEISEVQPIIEDTPKEKVNEQIVRKTTPVITSTPPEIKEIEHPSYEQIQSEIEENANKELEALAEKLRQKEEMLSEFIPAQSNTAPSSPVVENPQPSEITNKGNST